MDRYLPAHPNKLISILDVILEYFHITSVSKNRHGFGWLMRIPSQKEETIGGVGKEN